MSAPMTPERLAKQIRERASCPDLTDSTRTLLLTWAEVVMEDTKSISEIITEMGACRIGRG